MRNHIEFLLIIKIIQKDQNTANAVIYMFHGWLETLIQHFTKNLTGNADAVGNAYHHLDNLLPQEVQYQ